MKIKTALLISGDLRSYKNCYESLYRNIVVPLNCDIYLQMNENENNNDAIKLYNPKKYIIENCNNDIDITKFHHKRGETNVESVFCMWKNIKKCFDLINDDYNIYIKCRYDLKFDKPLDISLLQRNKINIPFGGDWVGGTQDMFAIANKDNMKYYCSMINDIENYYNQGIIFHPETLLKYHLKNTEIHRFDFPIIFNKMYDGKLFYEDRYIS